METDLLETLGPLIARLRANVEDRPELRGWLRDVGTVLIALAGGTPLRVLEPAAPPPAAPADTKSESNGHAPAALPLPVPPPPAPTPQPAAPPRLLVTPPPARAPGLPAWRDILLEELRDRCRLKAEAARWFADRKRSQRGVGPSVEELNARHASLIERARSLPDCFLWMCLGAETAADSPAAFDRLGDSFDVAAEAAELLYRLDEAGARRRDDFTQALHLAAEAQSALRAAVLAVGREKDPDQVRMFVWVKEAAAERQVWIARFMRTEDPADPANSDDLRQRLGQIGARLQESQSRLRKREKAFKNLRFKFRSPAEERDWPRIWEIVDELVNEGLPPSDVGLREIILPVRNEIPEGVPIPPNGERVLREIDRYLAMQAAPMPATSDDTGDDEPASEDVRVAAELLRGRAAVLIGGTPSPPHIASLKRALGLSELIWVETREHQTHAVFEPAVARDDVAVVLLAIRWSSHGFGEVKEFCDKYGKPLVHLPRGYNPNQVAHEIVNQAADRLAGAR